MWLDVPLCAAQTKASATVTDGYRQHGIHQIWSALTSVYHIHQKAHLVLDAEFDGQPIQILQHLCDVVAWSPCS